MYGIRLLAVISVSLTIGILLGAGVTWYSLRSPASPVATEPTPGVQLEPTPDDSATAACINELRNQVHIQPGTEPHVDAAAQAPNGGMRVVKVSLNTSESVRAQYGCGLLPIANSTQWQLAWLGRLQ